MADEKAALMAAWKAEKMDAAKAVVLADVTVRLMAVQWAARRANIMVASMAVTRAAKCWMQEEVMNLDIIKDLPVHLVE